MIKAKVIADSVHPEGGRLTTIEANIHRFVLAELNTHRSHSRNSASSRAIPVGKQLDRVSVNPAYPVVWASEQKGMQGGDPLEGDDLARAEALWDDVRAYTILRLHEYLDACGDGPRLHKSLINRLIEPFMWHRVILSSTELGWLNFFAQRHNPQAQPEMAAAAASMFDAYRTSTPLSLDYGGFHLPYVDDAERDACRIRSDRQHGAAQVSSARCARVSYLTHDGERDMSKDLDLYDRLVSADPGHWSPLEHPAMVVPLGDPTFGNFGPGWLQYRHMIELGAPSAPSIWGIIDRLA